MTHDNHDSFNGILHLLVTAWRLATRTVKKKQKRFTLLYSKYFAYPIKVHQLTIAVNVCETHASFVITIPFFRIKNEHNFRILLTKPHQACMSDKRCEF